MKRYPSYADGQIVTCFSKLATDVTKSHNAALCVDFLDLVQTGQEMRLWGNFDNCEKKDLRKYAESDFAYRISKFEERFVVHKEPKTKDVEVMAEYEIVVPEVVMTVNQIFNFICLLVLEFMFKVVFGYSFKFLVIVYILNMVTIILDLFSVFF